MANRVFDGIEISHAAQSLGLTLEEAERRMGIPQPKVSRMMSGDLTNLSEHKLMDCPNRLGYDIEIDVQPATEAIGQLRSPSAEPGFGGALLAGGQLPGFVPMRSNPACCIVTRPTDAGMLGPRHRRNQARSTVQDGQSRGRSPADLKVSTLAGTGRMSANTDRLHSASCGCPRRAASWVPTAREKGPTSSSDRVAGTAPGSGLSSPEGRRPYAARISSSRSGWRSSTLSSFTSASDGLVLPFS
jgi:predicted XRE-type DNA-binding protein